MPITFNEETNEFEGNNPFGNTLEGLDFSVFGGIISNSGTIDGPVVANSDQGIEVSNTLDGSISKAAGSSYAVDLLGNGGRNFFNDGTVFGNVRTGNGWDSFRNSGLVQGQLRLGNGNDLLTNQIIPGIDGGPFTIGKITGTVWMGMGDDTVLNAGVLNNVRLGGGNDTYTVGGFDLGLSDVPPPVLNDVSGDIRGEAGNDTLTGGDTDENFYGGSGDDLLIGNAGRDKLLGGSGNDEIFGGAGNDKIIGGAGADTIEGGDNNDSISGGNDDDLIFAGNGNDLVNGSEGNDILLGEAGNDRLTGADGNDTLEGGTGRDTMFGGAGEDVFVFRGGSHADEIRDFSENDQIALYFTTPTFVSFADVMAHTDFSSGHAVIDLSSVYNIDGFGDSSDHGSVLTLRNVSADDLDASSFVFYNDIFVVG